MRQSHTVVRPLQVPINSKAGRLALVKIKGAQGLEFKTVREEVAREQGLTNLLVPVFKDGEVLLTDSFANIRQRADVM